MVSKIEFHIVELWARLSSNTGIIQADYNLTDKLLVEWKLKDEKRKYIRQILLLFSAILALSGIIRITIEILRANNNVNCSGVDKNSSEVSIILRSLYILLALSYLVVCIVNLVFTIYWESLKLLFNQLLILQKTIG